MAKFNIKNQEDFNKTYNSLAPYDPRRAILEIAFQKYHSNYRKELLSKYNDAIRKDKQEGLKQEERAIAESVKHNTDLAMAGQPNKYFTPVTQEQRDKAKQIAQSKATQSIQKPSVDNYQMQIYDECIRQGLNPSIGLAVAWNESRFNPNAFRQAKGDKSKGTGPERSVGLFQINTYAHPDYKGEFNPAENIKYGVSLLKRLYDANNGDVKKTFERYNGSGPSARNYANIVYGIYQDINSGKPPFKMDSQAIPVDYNQNSVQQPQSSGYTPIDIDTYKNIFSRMGVQNAQEGGLNNIQDTDYLEQIKPFLKGQGMANEYQVDNPAKYYNKAVQIGLQDLEDMVRQAGGYGYQQQGEQTNMMQRDYNPYMLGQNNIDPYTTLRPYAQQVQQQAPIPQGQVGQPQNIRADVLDDYLKVIQGLTDQRNQFNNQMVQDFQQAQRADLRQNQVNEMVNAFGALGNSSRAPIAYVGADGSLRTVQLDQPGQATPLPTNTSSNMDAFKTNYALQAKNQADNKAMIDAYNKVTSAKAMGEVTGLPAEIFLEPDFYKTYAQYIQNPEIAQQAQFQRESRMVPLNTQSDILKEQAKTAGALENTNLKGQYDLNQEDIKGRYGLQNTALGGTIAGANTYRNALLNAQNARDIAQMNNLTAMAIANASNETKMELAKEAGYNAEELAKLQDKLYSNNPLRQRQATGQLVGAIANMAMITNNPQEALGYYNQINDLITGNTNPVATPQSYSDYVYKWNRQ